MEQQPGEKFTFKGHWESFVEVLPIQTCYKTFSFLSLYKILCMTSDYDDLIQIVDVNLTSEGKTKIEVGMTLTFTYQVCSSVR